METMHRAESPPVWRRVLACAATWLTFWPLSVSLAQCPPQLMQPGDYPEMEPNNSLPTAQPWPAFVPLFGEQIPAGDGDYFRVEGLPPDQSFEVLLQPDTFNPRLEVFGLMGGLWMSLGDADEGGWCEGERLVVGGWDPCLQLQPVEQVVVHVSPSPFSPPMNGSYRAQLIPQPTTVPQGDCCQYPLAASGPLFTDTRSTATAYRDMGFNPSPDVWYQLVLDQTTVLTAQTCGGSTNFDTELRVVAADCSTVLAQNDNSVRCAPSLLESWLLVSLDAGTYYVVVEGNGSASGTFTLNLRLATCPGVVPSPGAQFEVEPNDEPWMAQPWNPEQQLYGEQTPAGDPDFFRLMLPDPQAGFELTFQPDTFDPRLTVYAETPDGYQLVAEADNGGFCEAEVVSVAAWDPCSGLVPVLGYVVGVELSQGAGTLQSGAYLGSALVVSGSVPVGDCAQYPLFVSGLPYTDTRSTASSYRDQGFGPSPDVWYRLDLERPGLLTAQTCGGGTTFDTVLRLVAGDGTTVLAQNDNSLACLGNPTASWLSSCVSAGTCYVVVEGAGSATGTFQLDLALRPSGAAASLAVGTWGDLWEEPTRHFGDATSTLWLRADDLCGGVTAVEFLGSVPEGPMVMLGSDLDGWELPLATTPEGGPQGDGWFLEFDPALLRTDPGPVCFTALAHREDGTIQVVEAESWYAPDLEPVRLFEPFGHWEVVHDDIFTVVPGPDPLPPLEICWTSSVKQLEWSRAVPPVSQRGVSDTHCAPAAAAACLEWLDATYGTNVTGGLSGDSLTRALGGYMGTNKKPGSPGTRPSDMASGLERWIADHGGGYTVHSQYPATTAEMQNQGEAKGQDVITVLYWAGGGGHAVTLSSVHNLPNEDGTVAMDFMDPWTGSTQWGNFNPTTGAFSGYGDGNSSGTLGRSVYVCPASGGGGGARTEWQPFQGPIPIPVPEGLSWLVLQVRNAAGKMMEAFVIVERRPAVSPLVEITLDGATEQVHLAWEAVPDAVGYAVYRWPAGFSPPEGDAPWLVTGDTWADDEAPPAGQWFYAVKTLYEQ